MSKSKVNYGLRQKVFRSFCLYIKTIDYGKASFAVWAIQRIIGRFLLFKSYARIKLEALYTCPAWPRLLSLLPESCKGWRDNWYNKEKDQPTSNFFYQEINDAVARDATKPNTEDFKERPLIRKRRAQRDGKWTSCIFKFSSEFIEWLVIRRCFSEQELILCLAWLDPLIEAEGDRWSPAELLIKEGRKEEILPVMDGPGIDSIHLPGCSFVDPVAVAPPGESFEEETPTAIPAGDALARSGVGDQFSGGSGGSGGAPGGDLKLDRSAFQNGLSTDDKKNLPRETVSEFSDSTPLPGRIPGETNYKNNLWETRWSGSPAVPPGSPSVCFEVQQRENFGRSGAIENGLPANIGPKPSQKSGDQGSTKGGGAVDNSAPQATKERPQAPIEQGNVEEPRGCGKVASYPQEEIFFQKERDRLEGKMNLSAVAPGDSGGLPFASARVDRLEKGGVYDRRSSRPMGEIEFLESIGCGSLADRLRADRGLPVGGSPSYHGGRGADPSDLKEKGPNDE